MTSALCPGCDRPVPCWRRLIAMVALMLTPAAFAAPLTYTFEHDTEGWKSGQAAAKVAQQPGRLVLTFQASGKEPFDPFVEGPRQPFEAGTHPAIELDVTVEGGPARPLDCTLFFFRPNNTGFGRVPFSLKQGRQTVTLDMAALAGTGDQAWQGTIEYVRLDIPDSAGENALELYGAMRVLIHRVEVVPSLFVSAQPVPGLAGMLEVTVGVGRATRTEGAAALAVVDANGTTRTTGTCAPGERVRLAAPEGLCRVLATATVPGRGVQRAETALLLGDPAIVTREIEAKISAVRGEPAWAPYRGWLEYKYGLWAAADETTTGATTRARTNAAIDFLHWHQRLHQNPRWLAELRGGTTWAYFSKVDDSGQPFWIKIPEHYDPAHPAPLFIFLHGLSGDHSGQYPDFGLIPNAIYVAALGRARGSGYDGLGEVDILDLVDYVCATWSIDPDRIHLYGGSMGGGGTFNLAARHPDRFASARPLCGYGIDAPLENLLALPLYSLHSQDDYVVPVVTSRAPVAAINALGGHAVQEETNGYGHSVHNFREGLERAARWTARQHRPASTQVHTIRFAAQDELARRAWWLSVEEWGGDHRPARLNARMGGDNTLWLDSDNAALLRVDLAASPADSGSTLTVIVQGRPVGLVPPPLPARLFIGTADGTTPTLATQAPAMPTRRLHFPGGANALFHGEPLMVVWGTGGTPAMREAQRAISEVARRSPDASWPGDTPRYQGLPGGYMVYGKHAAKPDTAVTEADMERYNLLLLGTPEENCVVARLQRGLPVRLADGRITASDGVAWDFAGRAFGVLGVNPEHPRRLVYWVAADVAEFYRPEPMLMQMQGWSSASPDLLVTRAVEGTLVAARCLDSRWQWRPGYTASPLLPAGVETLAGRAAWIGELMRRATQADFTLTAEDAPGSQTLVSEPGVTRYADLAALEYDTRLATLRMTGAQIVRLRAARTATNETTSTTALRILPALAAGALKEDQRYVVALHPWVIWELTRTTQLVFEDYRLTDIRCDALLR